MLNAWAKKILPGISYYRMSPIGLRQKMIYLLFYPFLSRGGLDWELL